MYTSCMSRMGTARPRVNKNDDMSHAHLLHVEDEDSPRVHPVERGHQREGHDDGINNLHCARQRGGVEQRCVRAEIRHQVHDLHATEETVQS